MGLKPQLWNLMRRLILQGNACQLDYFLNPDHYPFSFTPSFYLELFLDHFGDALNVNLTVERACFPPVGYPCFIVGLQNNSYFQLI